MGADTGLTAGLGDGCLGDPAGGTTTPAATSASSRCHVRRTVSGFRGSPVVVLNPSADISAVTLIQSTRLPLFLASTKSA